MKIIVLDDVMDVFFEGMMNGYVNEEVKTLPVPNMPGWKMKPEFVKGDFRLIDMWYTNPNSKKSIGCTDIYYKEPLIWTMNYGGYYPKEVIPFLKKALSETYCTRKFTGGRGNDFFREGRYGYYNQFVGDFQKFIGAEEIVDDPTMQDHGEIVGWHQFSGMSLVDLWQIPDTKPIPGAKTPDTDWIGCNCSIPIEVTGAPADTIIGCDCGRKYRIKR